MQSAFAQYTAPGTRRSAGKGIVSYVLAILRRNGRSLPHRLQWFAAAGSAVGRTTRVVDHVHSRGLVASGIGLDHVPVEQREDFVEAGIAVQVGVVEVREAAIAEANVGRDQRKSRLGRLPCPSR